MVKKLRSLWIAILMGVLGLLGLNGCLLRLFSMAYGGPMDEPSPKYEEAIPEEPPPDWEDWDTPPAEEKQSDDGEKGTL